jgi:hypothetical protein
MKQPKKKKKKAVEEPKPTTFNQRDDNADFGGLPKRDLKKNLGCG